MSSIARLSGYEPYLHHPLPFFYENPGFNPFGLGQLFFWKRTGVCVCMCVHLFMCMCKHMSICVCSCVFKCICVCMCVLVSGCICFMCMHVFLCDWVSTQELMSPFFHKAHVQMVSCVLLIWRCPCISCILASEFSSKYIIQMHHKFEMGKEKSGATSFQYFCL